MSTSKWREQFRVHPAAHVFPMMDVDGLMKLAHAMRVSHEQLKITETEWAAFCKDFDDTMAKFGVPDAEKNELFAIVQSTKGDIVTG